MAFEIRRAGVGAVLAPLLFASVLLTPFPSLSDEGHRLAAVMAGVVVLWVTEALPLPVTALLGATLCVVLRVASAKEVFAPFADPLMFLFIGSFILARAIFLHRLDRRLALGVLSLPWVGARPGRLLFAYGAVTTFLSAWIANTAVTAMMFPIGLSMLSVMFNDQQQKGTPASQVYATGLMLMTSFGASVGGLATPVGTAPNLIGLGYIRNLLGVEIPFFHWALIGMPIAICLFVYLFVYLYALCAAGVARSADTQQMLRAEQSQLGNWTPGQVSTVLACGVTVMLWVLPGIIGLIAGAQSEGYRLFNTLCPEPIAALIGSLLLFVLPGDGGRRTLTWDEAVKIDWGVVLLYGGGFTLGVLSFQTGLAEAMGRGLTNWLPLGSGWGLLLAATLVAAIVSEATSNTASANMVIPVVIAIAQASGADPLGPALCATLGSSLGFMLPVSTPCNAIVYGSGLIPLGRMIRYGILLDIAGVAVIVTLVHLLLPWVR